MQKSIKVGNTERFNVIEVYPFMYATNNEVGKVVLRIVVDPSVKTYDELFSLLNSGTNPTIEEYWDEGENGAAVLKCEHENFCKDYKCAYNADIDYPNQYFIEITRKTAVEIQADKNQQLINANSLTLTELFESQS